MNYIIGTIISIGSNRIIKTKDLRWIVKKERTLREKKERNTCLKDKIIIVIIRGWWFIMRYNY